MPASVDQAPKAPQSASEERSERIVAAFNGLDKDNLAILAEFYAPDAVFEDPLGRHEGLEAIEAYYAGMYRSVQSIEFELTGESIQDDEHVVFWTMRMQTKALNKGREIVLEGASRIRFNAEDLVEYHRDYFDMGAMVYRHVPVLRWGVNKVNRRLNPSFEK